MQQESRREIFAFLIIGLAAFLWVCLLTCNPMDSLGPGDSVQNGCGPVGAFVGFHLTLWMGVLGAYGLAAVLGALGLAMLFRHSIAQPGWKALGTVLMILALSAFEVAVAETGPQPETLPGGYYGQFFHGFLLGQVSTFGTYLILALTVVIAFLISTDSLFYPAFARAGQLVSSGDTWENLESFIRRCTAVAGKLPRLRLPRPTISWDPRKPSKGAEEEKKKGSRTSSIRPAPEEPEGEDSPGARSAAAPKHPAPADDEGRAEKGKESPSKVIPVKEEDGKEAEAPVEPKADSRPPLKIHEPEPRPTSARKRIPQRTPSGPYRLPPLDLLSKPVNTVSSLDRSVLEQTAAKIEETLKHFKIEARVVEVQKGPTITQYELALAAGIKVHKIMNLSDDLAMALKAPSIRIVAPIPGKSTVGVEVPNKNRSTVGLRELLEAPEFREEDIILPLALGKDVAGTPMISDLGDMPHLLIAGSTGSGKSVCINSIITTLLLTRSPDEVKLILVDPKMVELTQFENIPHLLAPVVTDMKKAPAVLGWAVDKMEERYELFAMAGVRHITSYNALGREKIKERLEGKVDPADMDDFPDRLPFVVVIIDELADLMMTASKEVEASITRLSQKSRAVGIHVILATQRPSVDVITGLIKANMPSRISFHVASKVDSRTILDRNGAEKLLGKGDMLYLPPGTSALQRVQGTYIADKEIRDIVEYASHQAEPQFNPELTNFGVDSIGGTEEDELYEEAVRIVLGSRRGSVTLLQRQLQIGYTRASRLMEIMHEHGLVGPFKGSKAREVYYTIEEWEQAKAKSRGESADAEESEDDPESKFDPDEEAEAAS